MKRFTLSELITGISGLIVAPFLVKLTSDFFGDAYTWIPFVVILVIGAVLYAVGIAMLRGLAVGVLLGVVLFGVLLTWAPTRIGFIPYELRTLPPPF